MPLWMKETPVIAKTGKNILEYYHNSEKLIVGRLPWIDKDGDIRQGKTVTLDITAICQSDYETIGIIREFFAEILQTIDSQIERGI